MLLQAASRETSVIITNERTCFLCTVCSGSTPPAEVFVILMHILLFSSRPILENQRKWSENFLSRTSRGCPAHYYVECPYFWGGLGGGTRCHGASPRSVWSSVTCRASCCLVRLAPGRYHESVAARASTGPIRVRIGPRKEKNRIWRSSVVGVLVL